MNENSNLDPTALERLMRLGGGEFVIKIIDLFLSYAAEKVAEARRGFEAADLPGITKAAHPIKSSAGNVGARRVQEAAQRLEELSQRGESGPLLREVVGELELAFAAVKPELEAKKQLLQK